MAGHTRTLGLDGRTLRIRAEKSLLSCYVEQAGRILLTRFGRRGLVPKSHASNY